MKPSNEVAVPTIPQRVHYAWLQALKTVETSKDLLAVLNNAEEAGGYTADPNVRILYEYRNQHPGDMMMGLIYGFKVRGRMKLIPIPREVGDCIASLRKEQQASDDDLLRYEYLEKKQAKPILDWVNLGNKVVKSYRYHEAITQGYRAIAYKKRSV